MASIADPAAVAVRTVGDAAKRDLPGFWRLLTTLGIVAILSLLAYFVTKEVTAGAGPIVCPPAASPDLESRVRVLETFSARFGAQLESIQASLIRIESRLPK